MRTIELNANELKELLLQGEISLGFASQTLHLFDEGSGLELLMNYLGYGYKPVKVSIDFEYDEDIKFTESECE